MCAVADGPCMRRIMCQLWGKQCCRIFFHPQGCPYDLRWMIESIKLQGNFDVLQQSTLYFAAAMMGEDLSAIQQYRWQNPLLELRCWSGSRWETNWFLSSHLCSGIFSHRSPPLQSNFAIAPRKTSVVFHRMEDVKKFNHEKSFFRILSAAAPSPTATTTSFAVNEFQIQTVPSATEPSAEAINHPSQATNNKQQPKIPFNFRKIDGIHCSVPRRACKKSIDKQWWN